MGEWWAAAVAAAGEQPPADLSAAVAEELIALWSDLGEAIRRAADRSWSVECDGLVVRIVMLSRLTAATPWQWIPVPLLVRGVYQGLLESAGIAFTSPCMAEVHGRARRPQQASYPAPSAAAELTGSSMFGPRRPQAGAPPLCTVVPSREPKRSAPAPERGTDSTPGGVGTIPGYARRSAPNTARSATIQISGYLSTGRELGRIRGVI